MKIRGRFIGILAVLGLLMALVPLATAGAVEGELTLNGGEKGQFFSDRIESAEAFNVVTIDVEDSDLTPARVGKARYESQGGADFNLNNAVVGGEQDKVDELNGANLLCDDDGDEDDTNVAVAERTARVSVEACRITDNNVSGGDAVYTHDDGNDDGVIDEGEDLSWEFALSEPARDTNGDGDVDEEDIEVVVDGVELEINSGFTLPEPNPAIDGGGINRVIVLVDPADTQNNVRITYEVTEYEFNTATPIRLSGTQVHFGTAFATADEQKQIDSVGVASVTTTSSVDGTPFVVVTFVYNVKDTAKKYVTVTTNTSLATGVDRVLDGAETTARSSLFSAKIVLFEGADYTNVVNQVTNSRNDWGALANADEGVTGRPDNGGNDDGVIQISELNNTSVLGDELFGRVTLTVTELYKNVDPAVADPMAVKAEDLINMLIPATHGDTLSVTYVDENPSRTVTKTAEVDLEAPQVTLVGPGDGIYTNESLTTLSAEVVDAGAGVEQGNININSTSSGVALGLPLRVPIVDGYRVTRVPRSAISEGAKEWFVTVVDKVGNVPNVDIPDEKCTGTGASEVCTGSGPAGVNEGTKGAVAHGLTVSTNPFKFAVDSNGPKLNTGKTGVSLKNPGVTTGEMSGRESEQTSKRQWLRVVFDPEEGTAPLDPDTVAADDFLVDGEEPLDAMVNVRDHGEIKKGTAVYLQVAELDTDDRPKVVLQGEVMDRAGNTRGEGSLTAIVDGLAPVLTVTPSGDIANDEITLTVTASERLGLNPDVQVTTTKPSRSKVDGETVVDLGAPSNLRVSLVTGGLTTWTATYENPASAANKWYVVVDVSDQAGNRNTVGDASTETDFVSFQVDDAEPSLKFKSAGGTALDDSDAKPEEGAVWIVGEFDEDEHAGDNFRKVTVTALTLTNLDADEVVAEDVEVLFGGEVECVDHDVEGDVTLTGTEEGATKATAAQKDKCVEHTLAVSLTPGMYMIEMTGVDSVGNEVTEDVKFEVTEAEPFELGLRPGQNFISIPGMPMGDGGNIDTLLADEAISSISTYDRSRELQGESPWLRSTKDLETGMFSGDITAVEPGKAYFINSTASVTLEISLQASGDLPPTIPVRQGYNAIGFWAVAGDAYDEDTLQGPTLDSYLNSLGWTVAYTYDPTPGRGWEVLRKGAEDEDFEPLHYVKAGKGYLVYALYDTVLTP